ncbi:hypothetical protein Glove_495g46 [Diversispora epigaea]|uniref:Uncharacterized protein n=1 Tax=Diversispora epigaea TaxID=1348612 RepID=A0A397GM49_9GLOM|nr:hypothetical protein Glove_495g46 [Diversispora epigaea]
MFYHIRSGQESNTGLRNPSELVNSTSEFGRKDIKALDIQYLNGNMRMFEAMPDSPYDDSLLVQNVNKKQLYDFFTDDSFIKNWNNKEKALAGYISDVLMKEFSNAGKCEKVTDSFVNFLLGGLEFNMYPFFLDLKANCYFRVLNKKITSETDFSIRLRKSNLYVIIDEDKHLHNVNKNSWWGECQIAGKLLASAFVNHKQIQGKYRY